MKLCRINTSTTVMRAGQNVARAMAALGPMFLAANQRQYCIIKPAKKNVYTACLVADVNAGVSPCPELIRPTMVLITSAPIMADFRSNQASSRFGIILLA